jgi:hypothetical protein
MFNFAKLLVLVSLFIQLFSLTPLPARAEQRRVVVEICENALFGQCLKLKVDPRLVNEVIYIKDEKALLFFYPLLSGEKGVELVSWEGIQPTHFNNGIRTISVTVVTR